VDGVPGKAADRVRAGAVIQVPVSGADAPAGKDTEPNSAPNRDLDILWENADFLVLNKPAGLATHGPGRGSEKSLETLVQAYLAPKIPPSLSFKPGPLHRLDKPTSGIIVFSASLAGAQLFSALLRERRIRKTYLAILDGIMDRDETWEDILARDRALGKSFTARGTSLQIARGTSLQIARGTSLQIARPGDTDPGAETGEDAPREARTRVYPLAHAAKAGAAYTLARLELDTGRTHQIRAQAAARRHPLSGDRKYGGSEQRGGLLLHAWKLELPGQALPGLPRQLEAPLPENFRKQTQDLFGGEGL
jgi:23S rRNA pseudouridine955/2504/2580 synthase